MFHLHLTADEARVLKAWLSSDYVQNMIGCDNSPTPDVHDEHIMWDIIAQVEELNT